MWKMVHAFSSQIPDWMRSKRFLLISIYLYTLFCAAGNAWDNRFWCGLADSVCYVDLGKAFAAGRWMDFVNSYWSPFFPALLGILFYFTSPNLQSIYPIVNLAHFLTLLGSSLAALFFLRELVFYRNRIFGDEKFSSAIVDDYSLQVLGLLLFFNAALVRCSEFFPGPNVLFLTAVLLVFGQLLRIKRGKDSYLSYSLLGGILGLGYYLKTPILLPGLLVITLAGLVFNPLRFQFKKVVLSGLVLASCLGPWVIALHHKYGYWTIGDTARLNYAFFVTEESQHLHGHLIWPDPSKAVHPSRTLSTHPKVMEFSEPIFGTFPIWVDPPYWQQGLEPQFSLTKQVVRIQENLSELWSITTSFPEVAMIVALGILFIVSWAGRNLRFIVSGWFQYWFLILPSLCGIAMFVLVYIEPRHIAGFWFVISAAILSGLRLPQSEFSSRIVRFLIVFIGLSLLSQSWTPCRNFASLIADLTIRTPKQTGIPQDHAIAAKQLGVNPGDKLCSLDNPGYYGSSVIALCEAQIVAEVLAEDISTFKELSESERLTFFQALREENISFILANKWGPGAPPAGWKLLGQGPPLMILDIQKQLHKEGALPKELE